MNRPDHLSRAVPTSGSSSASRPGADRASVRRGRQRPGPDEHRGPSLSETGTIEVLHIDDNLGDLHLAHAAFTDCCPHVSYRGETNAVEAMTALSLRAAQQEALPGLMVLDLNMPCVRGQDVLRFLHGHDVLKHLPVVVLSTSMLESEASECRRLGASDVLHKPDTYVALVALASAMLRYATPMTPQPQAFQ